MKPREILGLVGTRKVRGAERCHSIDDLRAAAVRRLPRVVMDFVDGGSESETTLARNATSLDAQLLRPRMGAAVGAVDLGRTILGVRHSVPFLFGPTGFTGLVRPRGELLVARGAARADVAYVVSAVASTTPMRELPGQDGRWINLYPLKDHGLMTALMDGWHERGARTLVLTIDVPVAGARYRDLRNGMAIPPRIGLRTTVDGLRHPRWTGRFLSGPSIGIPDMHTGDHVVSSTAFPSLFTSDFGWDYVGKIASQWRGDLVVKGILHPDDARLARDAGARAVVVSNHGGRQLDGAIAAFDALRPVVDAVGSDVDVLVDSGFRRGRDIAAALARGARGVLIGRGYLYGLAAYGEDGVARSAQILRTELTRALHLAGVAAADDITEDLLAP